MEFRILGPLEVERDGNQLALGPTKQRALLALLLLHSNRVVPRAQLLDGLWGESPPETAPTALHGYVSGLRKALGKDRIETRSGGYLLHADPDELDLERFERLADDAHTLESRPAADQLREALALWRGAPLSDLDGAPFLEGERRRLEEVRLGVVEDRVDADLALGRHADVVAELDALVRAHPLRERLRGQLMLALYRAGRQAEALEVYRQGRNLLFQELGLEPGEELKRLERGILEHDPALGPVAVPKAPPAAGTAPPAGPRARRGTRPRSRWMVVAAAVVILTLAGATGIVLALTGGSRGLAVLANSVAVIDPKANTLVDDVPVGTRPVAIAVGEGGVWVGNEVDRTVDRIDPSTRKVTDVIGVGTDVHDVAVGYGSVWVADGTDGSVTRIDAATDHRILGRVVLSRGASPRPVFWVAVGAGAVWATSGDYLVRMDPATGKVVSRTELYAAPAGLAVGKDVWVVTGQEQLMRLMPNGTFDRSTDLQAPGLAPTIGRGSLWMIVYLGRGVVQPIDLESLQLEPGTQVAAFPVDVAVGAGSVWSVDVRGTVLRIDPETASMKARVRTAPTLRSSIAFGAGAVWVANQGT